ncbi:BCL-6 corepressor-like [Sesbania bispinosa]|nr:BCL-6 corepressor-like [Sesbania bispinosa]
MYVHPTTTATMHLGSTAVAALSLHASPVSHHTPPSKSHLSSIAAHDRESSRPQNQATKSHLCILLAI